MSYSESPEFTKDPDADLDYTFDWTEWLGVDTILNSTFYIENGQGLVQHDGFITDGKKATVWLRGGKRGSSYKALLTNSILTAEARVNQRSMWIRVEEQ